MISQDAVKKKFRKALEGHGVNSISPDSIIERVGETKDLKGLLDDSEIEKCLVSIKPNYNINTSQDDIAAINSISRYREGKKYSYIESCKAVFVTSNYVLVKATRDYIKNNKLDFGFPLAITVDDLCVLTWLKDFEINNDIPKMRLLENASAAVNPSSELIETYYEQINALVDQGDVSEDEAALLRIEQYAKQELMKLTHGDKEKVDNRTISQIRESVFSDKIQQGHSQAEKKYQAEREAQRNRACKQAEDETNNRYKIIENRGIILIRIVLSIIALVFLGASLYSLYEGGEFNWGALVIFFVTLVESITPLTNRDNFIIRQYKSLIKRKRLKEIDELKEKYMSLLE